MVPWWLRSEKSRLQQVHAVGNEKWPAIIERSLRDKSAQVQQAAAVEGLQRGSAQLQSLAITTLSRIMHAPFSLLDSLPHLVDLASSKDPTVSASALDVIKRLRGKIPGGRGAWPRCGSSSATEGNATGWRCNGCGLRYKEHGGRDPIVFAITGGFRGGPPWKQQETVNLLHELELVQAGEDKPESWWAECRQRAQDLASQRRELLRALND